MRELLLPFLAVAVPCCTHPTPPPPNNPATANAGEETVSASAPIDIKTAPVAQSETDTVAQIAAAAPGKGWFCFDTRHQGTAVATNCSRANAKCQEERTDRTSAFGDVGGVSYGPCQQRAHAYCFVVRVHAEFVPPDLQTVCAAELAECGSSRAVFAKDAKMEVGAVCVGAD